MAGIVILYSVLLFLLGFLTSRVSTEFGRTPFLVSAIGSGLCLLWALAGAAGYKNRSWLTLSLAVIALALLTETVGSWFSPHPASVRGLLSLSLLVTVAALMYVLHGERTPEFYNIRTSQPDTARKGNR